MRGGVAVLRAVPDGGGLASSPAGFGTSGANSPPRALCHRSRPEGFEPWTGLEKHPCNHAGAIASQKDPRPSRNERRSSALAFSSAEKILSAPQTGQVRLLFYAHFPRWLIRSKRPKYPR